MGTKNNPGKFDCYQRAAPDEPMFVLLARDPLAPIVVRLWADLRAHLSGNPSKVLEARECAETMDVWRQKDVAAMVRPMLDARAHAGDGDSAAREAGAYVEDDVRNRESI